MKKRISFLLVAVLLLATVIPAFPVLAADGETVANTFNANDANPKISTAADYLAFFKAAFCDSNVGNFSGKTITMMNDITLNDTTVADWYTKEGAVKLEGNGTYKWFEGTFDGGNHTLRGAIPSGTFRNDVPFAIFPAARNATIKNLVVDGFYVCSPNTTIDPADGFAGIGGLVGYAKIEVTIDNVTMRNGIVTCVENGRGGIGALIGTFDGAQSSTYGDRKNLVITNCTIENSVQVVAGANSGAYTGGLVGVVSANTWDAANRANGHFQVNLIVTGSVFAAVGVADKPLGGFGYCENKANGVDDCHIWIVKNDATGYQSEKGFYKKNNSNQIYADPLNALLVASGAYGASAAPVVRPVAVQLRTEDNGVRFVGLLKKPTSLDDVTALGFEVTVGDKTVGADKIACTKVYESIMANGKTLTAPEGYYYFTFVVTDVTTETTFAWSACATVGGKTCKTTVSSYTYTPAAD